MDRADVVAVFHDSGGRVERIEFSPPAVIPLEPTTITAGPPPTPERPPRPSPPPRPGRPGRGEEACGEVAGVPGILSGGRTFYGIHATRHNTMCYGQYDAGSDTCHGVETTNDWTFRMHWEQGFREYRYLCVHAAEDRRRFAAHRRRMRSGARPNAPYPDRLYRQGALEAHRRHMLARRSARRGGTAGE
jgi:hypothetical protein